MRPSESLHYDIRGLRYHVRHWPGRADRRMVLLHGWMDVSASFQFLVDALAADWDVYAPDWRGYGLTDWDRSDCYWFPDYLADLEQVLDRIQPDAPINLVGHSLGGNVGALYAGVRPARIAKFVNLEGFGMSRTQSEQAPQRYARWLDELRDKPALKPYASFAALADRLQKNNPRLRRDRAEFLARHWGRPAEDGGVALRSDPAHKIVNPMLYRYEEARACWERITAPVLWVDAAESKTLGQIGITPEDYAERRAAHRTLRYETVQEAGHMLHHDQPERVARLIEDFLLDGAT
ncbi:MAG: alpha/beta hydrolase [Betaproteobacteria bacterium]|jgi:pimeloyl-ACP methyl ester carboxylesterase|nr:alpha/beta hydrolase [Betaproteobacteria bacterium]